MPHGRSAKRRRLTPPVDDGAVSETIKPSDLLSRAVDWDLEQDYEQRSKKKKTEEVAKLPRKTREGKLFVVREKKEVEDESDSFLGSGTEDEDEDKQENEETPPTEDLDEEPQIPLRQQITEAKEEIARLAGLLNEDPEEHVGSFKKLALVAGPDAPPAVQKISLAAQAAVYKDNIPGYRIRAYKDEDLGNKVSKDVRRARQYEHGLVTGYQAYVKTLTSLTKLRGKGDGISLKSVALNCACTLLLSVPHFNLRTDLLNIIVHELAARERTPDFYKSISTLEQFFQNDQDGAPSLEAVNILSKMLKAKDYHVREEVLNTFLHLRLLTELSARGSTTQTEKPRDDTSKLHGRKIKKEKFEHRSKKMRKIIKERKAVEKDMREANAEVDYEAREKMQSETLKVVFVIYFRILKARAPELMGAVLEGLARYAHLINQDFFGDILEALKDIISQAESIILGDDDDENGDNGTYSTVNEASETARNLTRETLLSTQTAFTLLSHQETLKSASSLHLDLTFFTNHIYRSLYPLTISPDLELGPKSLHLPDPTSPNYLQALQTSTPDPRKINIRTPILLLTRALNSILLTPTGSIGTSNSSSSTSNNNISPTLLASFLKRLLTVVLQTPEKSTQSILALLLKITHKHTRKIERLWYSDERNGDGVYNGAAETVDGTHVWSVGSGVWEGELLRKHWCPEVRERWREIEKVVVVGGNSGGGGGTGSGRR